jgi:Protein of unknown function (DUF3168)
MMQEGLYSLLAADAGVSALVGANIFQIEAPDDLSFYPCATYKCIAGTTEDTLDGCHVIRQRVELAGYAAGPGAGAKAARIRAAIIKALDGWKQTLADGTDVKGVELINPATDFCSEQRIFRCMCEFYVLYSPGN